MTTRIYAARKKYVRSMTFSTIFFFGKTRFPFSSKHISAEDRMQLTAWLKRNEGRPGVAQSSMAEQIIDVPVTSSRVAEATAYEV